MKKRSFILILCFCCVLLAGGVTIFGLTNSPIVCYAQSTVEETSETTEEIENTENNTFLGRTWEWIVEHKTEIIVILTDLATLFGLYQTFKSKFKKVDKGITQNNSTQADTVDAVNGLITAYNSLEDKQVVNEKNAEELMKYAKDAYTTSITILNILSTVYANSKNLPQGVKDLVNLKYAELLKIVSADNNLKSDEVEVKEEIKTDTEE